MHAELKAHVAFHLTGKRPSVDLDAVEQLRLRPALLVRYRDLASLRYDFPLVLADGAGETRAILSLTAIVNGVLREIAPQGAEGEQLRKHVLKLEREIRTLASAGAEGSLSSLWATATARLAAGDASLARSLERARAALDVDGEVIDCHGAMPAALAQYAWRGVQERKAAVFRKTVNRLIQKLSDILRSDFVHSDAGQSAETLKAAVGTAHAEIFDFEAMSRVLGKSLARHPLPQGRRARIEWALATLEGQRFFDLPERHAAKPHNFLFETCAGALKAYRERLPEVVALAKAVALAELEIDGLYVEAQHDEFFGSYGEEMLDAKDAAVFPDYLVHVHADHLQPAEHERMNEILASSLPIKILLQNDDILDASPITGTRPAFSTRSARFARAAMEGNAAYVVQAPASHAYQFRDRLLAGMAYNGPALFSIYSGVAGMSGGLPPYLSAAAALSSRAFPAFVYDPSAGDNLASRFDLDDNPDAERDWPVQSFTYEDEAQQSVTEALAFTFVDFVACDARYSQHFARVPRTDWNDRMAPVVAVLDGSVGAEAIPYLHVVCADDRLHKVLVDEKLMKEARRCKAMWRNLQELGGIHNSHAERLLARERKAWLEEQQRAAPVAAPSPAVAAPASEAAGAPPAAAETPQPAAEEVRSDEAYIETPRCSSCNECIQLNGAMFAYDGNQQAYIANLDAGTYRELVEAAESCQVSVIHPGKPRNANEPDLEELIKRAEPFL